MWFSERKHETFPSLRMEGVVPAINVQITLQKVKDFILVFVQVRRWFVPRRRGVVNNRQLAVAVVTFYQVCSSRPNCWTAVSALVPRV